MVDYKKDELYEEIGLCKESKKCKKCRHCAHPSNSTEISCDYILNVGHRRPCPAGKHCTVYEAKKSQKKKKVCA